RPVAVGGAAAARLVQPGAAADDPVPLPDARLVPCLVTGRYDALLRPCRVLLRAILVIVRVVEVLAPLADAAVHVVQAPGVRLVRAHLARPPQVLALVRAAVGEVAVEVRLLAGEGLAEVERRLGASAAAILPFRLGRQAVLAPRLLLLRPGVE